MTGPPHQVRARIDAPTAGAQVARGLVRVSGWVLDEAGPLESALLVVDDGPGSALRLGASRPDVGEAYPAVLHASASGFDGTVDLRTAGEAARIALLVRLGDGTWREAAAVEVNAVAPAREHDGARRSAAFTIVHNESVMLPVWLDYYSRYFSADDLYVLDHDSDDGSTAGIGACVVPIHREAAYDHHWLRSTVEAFQAFLLRSYDTVLFAEVDELVVADPLRHSGLDGFIDGLTSPAVRCVGYNVVHQPDEPPLRFDQPLLAQRSHWHASRDYCKRLLSRIPLHWSNGFHDEYNAPDDPPDPELLLVHLHRVDYDACLARHQASAARAWNEDDVLTGRGGQNRIAEAREFEEWFRGVHVRDAPLEPIPEHIRSVL